MTKNILLKKIMLIMTSSILGISSIVFGVLYVECFDNGFIYNYSTVLTAIFVSIVSVISAFSITFIYQNQSENIIYKLLFSALIIITLLSVSLFLICKLNILDKIDSIEDLRNYINSFGAYGVLIFILIQFAQVVLLPIPGVITIGAGVLLFGSFYGAIYSFIGIYTGSIVSFFLGRIFGYKIANWLVGEEQLKKTLKLVKGKDNLILTFMFLFPFFPDDALCFVAGITTVSTKFFIIMTAITRLITVFASSYSLNNSIIPYDTWWGILLWIIFFSITVFLTFLICKKGNKIQKFLNKFRKKKSSSNN